MHSMYIHMHVHNCIEAWVHPDARHAADTWLDQEPGDPSRPPNHHVNHSRDKVGSRLHRLPMKKKRQGMDTVHCETVANL